MIRINLLGEKQDNAVIHTLQVFAFGCVMVLTMAACYVHYSSTATELELAQREKTLLNQRLVALREKTKKVENLEKSKVLLKEKLMTISELKAKKNGPVHILHDITQAIPQQAWLTGVSQKSDALEFQGFALDNQTISVFMKTLEASPYFGAVDLVDSRLQKKDGVPLQKFILLVKLRSALEARKIAKEREQAEAAKSAEPAAKPVAAEAVQAAPAAAGA